MLSNNIKGKFCVYVCVSVRYRTSLNVVGMGSQLLGELRRTLRWSSTGKMLKKNYFKKWSFLNGKLKENGKTEGNGKQKQEQERGRERERRRERERGRERETCSTRATPGTPH
jgi:hypothetical protein